MIVYSKPIQPSKITFVFNVLISVDSDVVQGHIFERVPVSRFDTTSEISTKPALEFH